MENMEPSEISEIRPPSATTITRWASEESWDEQRQLKNSSTLEIGLKCLEQINMILQQAKDEGRTITNAEADRIVKLRKMIQDLNRDLSYVSNAIDAVGLFMQEVREKHPEAFEAISQTAVDFTRELAKKFEDL